MSVQVVYVGLLLFIAAWNVYWAAVGKFPGRGTRRSMSRKGRMVGFIVGGLAVVFAAGTAASSGAPAFLVVWAVAIVGTGGLFVVHSLREAVRLRDEAIARGSCAARAIGLGTNMPLLVVRCDRESLTVTNTSSFSDGPQLVVHSGERGRAVFDKAILVIESDSKRKHTIRLSYHDAERFLTCAASMGWDVGPKDHHQP